MADAEARLPRLSTVHLHSGSNPDVTSEEIEIEKQPEKDWQSSSAKEASEDPIVHHYLTFTTNLPPPAQPLPLDAPLCPDLTPYISPFLWSEKRKTFMTWLSCAATVVTAYTPGSYAAGTTQMMDYWQVSDVAITVGITTFTTGFAIAPMFLAPFSEINGRRPVFVISGILFVLLQLCCALTRSYPGMLVARFFTGYFSSTFSTMVGGVISDIYHAEDRNKPMALFSGAALFGAGLGPLVSGSIAQNMTWRWVFYLQVITCGTLIAAVVLFFKETRGSVILSRKAKVLNDWYAQLEKAGHFGVLVPTEMDDQKSTPHRIRWKVKSDEERETLRQMISISLYRPLHLLFTEPVVFSFSLWISFSWAVLYLTFDTIPLVFEENHGFNLAQSGAVFAAIPAATIISTVISIYQEPLARKILSSKRRAFLDSPEGRLYFSCIQSALLPIGCFWFGWTSFPGIPWIVPALAIGCATMGIFSIILAVSNYLADTYHRYASSALAAQSMCRNLVGGAFPLITRQMFKTLTFQGAGSLLGGIGAISTLVPWVLVFFGPKIRARSKFASEIMHGEYENAIETLPEVQRPAPAAASSPAMSSTRRSPQ